MKNFFQDFLEISLDLKSLNSLATCELIYV